MADEPIVWGIHAGSSGQAEELFLKKNVISIGWDRIGDLAQWQTQEQYKAVVAQAYPDDKAGAVPVYAGILRRFAHEMDIGQFVVYPCKSQRTIWVGEITGPYAYRPDIDANYPHQRSVTWCDGLPRTRFSQGALYEVGSAVTLFRVSNHADEFIAIARGQEPTSPVEVEGETSIVAREIEEQTRDFVLKRISKHLKGHPFAEFVADLLGAMGYKTRISPPGPDHGIDILAHPDELGFQPPLVKVQVKSSEETVNEAAVSQLYGKVDSGEFGLFVTLGGFTPGANGFALSKGNLRLMSGDDVLDTVFAHYDSIDARYKGMIPLRPTYIPEGLENVED
ncbi:MAG: restriction endonuclease [candidate division WS1 bacterium]|nr:restriction endonuclease [candidate division WS1 bacterium]